MNPSEATPPAEWSRGWPVVFSASAGYGIAAGLFALTAGLFYNPMRQEFGWTMSQVAFAPYVYLLIAIMMPVGGIVIEKVGARPVAIFGTILFGVGYIALATLPLTLLLLYAIVACLGILGPSINAGPYLRVVATWFRRHVGLAFGLTTAGTSFAGFLLLPLVAAAITEFGWRGGYLALAALQAFIALPILLWLFRENRGGRARNKEEGLTQGISLRQAFASVKFWIFLFAVGCAGAPIGVYLTHMQPILQNAGFTVVTGATYGSLFAVAIGVGRIGGGMLVDRFWSFGVAAAAIGIGVIGCLIITSVTPATPFWLTAVAVCTIGLAYGAEVDFGGYFTLKLFGLENFDRIFGFVALVLGVTIAAGGILGSALFDLSDSYSAIGRLTALGFALSSLSFLALGILERRCPSS